MRLLNINLKKYSWSFSVSIGKKWWQCHPIYGVEFQKFNNERRRKYIIYLTLGKRYVMLYYVRFLQEKK